MTKPRIGSLLNRFSDFPFPQGDDLDFIYELTGPVIDVARGLIRWQRSTQMCSAPSHAFLYTFMASSTAIALGGVYVWRRFIRTQPISKPTEVSTMEKT